jgi:dienelactone hydrolase
MGATFGPWALKHRDAGPSNPACCFYCCCPLQTPSRLPCRSLSVDPPAVTLPIWQDFLKAVRAEPETKTLIAVGFCFGGRHAILAASGESPFADAAVAFHPVR